jgi:hypothetical protein
MTTSAPKNLPATKEVDRQYRQPKMTGLADEC